MVQKISNQNYNANSLECPNNLCNHNQPENDQPSIHQKCSPNLGKNSEGPPENMPPDETVIRLTSRHFPSMPLPNQGGKNQSSVNRCQLCYANGNRSAIEEAVSELNMCTISVLQHQVCILTNVLKFIIAKRTMDLMMNSFFIIV